MIFACLKIVRIVSQLLIDLSEGTEKEAAGRRMYFMLTDLKLQMKSIQVFPLHHLCSLFKQEFCPHCFSIFIAF